MMSDDDHEDIEAEFLQKATMQAPQAFIAGRIENGEFFIAEFIHAVELLVKNKLYNKANQLILALEEFNISLFEIFEEASSKLIETIESHLSEANSLTLN